MIPIKQFIIDSCFWILGKMGVVAYVIPDEIRVILPTVRQIVQNTSEMPGFLSNEYRHAHTYATLKKRLPEASSKSIGYAIEAVLYGIV